MGQDALITISKFSRMTNMKQEALRHYDRIGLLSPEIRGKNGYRYYSQQQLADAHLVHDLRGVGIGLEDIKLHSENPTPEGIYALCLMHSEKVKEEIAQLQQTHQIVLRTLDMIREALDHKKHDFFLQELEDEPVFLCEAIPAHMTFAEGEHFSYVYAAKNGIDTRHLNGFMLVHEPSGSEAPVRVRVCYFKYSCFVNAHKPTGLYAVAYGLSPLTSDTLYSQLLDYIAQQGLRVCGNVYVEFPFGMYVLPQQVNEYCLRIEIPVEKNRETKVSVKKL